METNKTANVILGIIALALIVVIVLLAVHKKASAPAVDTNTPPGTSVQGNQPTNPPATDEAPVAVSGMQEYTDTNFGFSFWYPNTWAVQPNANAVHTVLSGGSIIESIAVGPNTDPNGGVTIQEFNSSAKSIFDNSNCGPADGCPVSLEYYFNPTTHLWMKTSVDHSQVTQTSVADISVNTMGGLHIFNGNMRFASDVIVPLSASHFLVVSSTSPGGLLENPLANTIVAADPAVATPVGDSQQVQVIEAEMTAYAGE
jgi:hypothetical protein